MSDKLRPRLEYRAEIDGLRALAVLPVILFHMGFDWIPGGFIGVDVFFVISGFLITSILKSEFESNSFTFLGFWLRRLRRIAPALLVMTATVLTVTCFFAFKPDRAAIGKQSLFALLSVANFYFWRASGDYWSPRAEESPLLHTWSLAIEEQFYLIFPVLLSVVFRVNPRGLSRFLVAVTGISFALFLWGSATHPTATFYQLPMRAWELSAGSLAAVFDQRRRSIPRSLASGVCSAEIGLVLLIACYGFVHRLHGGVACAVFGTTLIIHFSRSGFCNSVLSLKPMVYVGKMSYSLYLWHWPVLVLATKMRIDWHKITLALPIFVLSWMSYHLIEQPTRRWERGTPWITSGIFALLCISACCGFASRSYDTSEFSTPTWHGKLYDLAPSGKPSENYDDLMLGVDVPERPLLGDAYSKEGIIIGTAATNPSVVVFGDSHGVMWSEVIRTVVEKHNIKTSFFSMNGVSPFIDFPVRNDQQASWRLSSQQKYQYDVARLRCIKEWKPRLVIICNPWDGRGVAVDHPFLKYIKTHADRVLLMEPPPVVADVGNRNMLQHLCYLGVLPEEGVKKYLKAETPGNGQELIRSLSRDSQISCISVHDLYFKNGKTLVLDAKNVVYLDDDHLTTYGASIAARRIEDAILLALSMKTESQR
jgi:peptidoglycan/LPS O-acetylase OafA/YrhL